VCACGGLLLDKILCVKCELRRNDKHCVLGPLETEAKYINPMVYIIGKWMYTVYIYLLCILEY